MTRTPRLLHVLSQLPGRSGSGVFLQAMVREAARRGYRQHVVVAGPPGTTAAEIPGLDRHDFTLAPFPSPVAPFPVPGNSDVMPYPSTVFSQMSGLQVQQYLDLWRAVLEDVRRRFSPELVHAHHLWLVTAVAREVFADRTVIATSHNAELRQVVKAPHLLAKVVGGVRRLDRICVLTPRSVHDTVEAFGVDIGRIEVTGAGYDAGLFRPADQDANAVRARLRRDHKVDLPVESLVTFVGRLSTAKGVPFLLEAAALARRRGAPRFHLVLVGAVGSGPDGARTAQLVRDAGNMVLHVGPLSPEAVAGVLQCSDLFVLPSLFEGLPLTMLEAGACGCPCLVSGLPTIRSWAPRVLIDRGDLILVPPLLTTDADVPVGTDIPRFIDDLARKVGCMLSARGDRSERAAAFLPHSWSAVFDRYECVYQ